MGAIIRAASPDDAAAIAGVHVTSLRASATDLLPAHLTPILLPPADAAPRTSAWRRWIERARTSTFVAHAGATVTGFCTLHPAADERGAGVGAAGAGAAGGGVGTTASAAGVRTAAGTAGAGASGRGVGTAGAGVAGGSVGAAAGAARAGTVRPVTARGRGEIASLYVLPTEWRRGTGRRLGERALAEARERGFAEVMVWVLETNSRARRFYEALGFRPDGESKIFLERPYASWRELRYRRAV